MTKPIRPSHARQPRRAPGRPGTDSPDLRATLVEAALACFVRDGIAATSLRGIAAQAGVTPAMLNYYFGSKLA
ncbi:TetR/AcrR family transcriptional regulator, partial [Dyella japonica]